MFVGKVVNGGLKKFVKGMKIDQVYLEDFDYYYWFDICFVDDEVVVLFEVIKNLIEEKCYQFDFVFEEKCKKFM